MSSFRIALQREAFVRAIDLAFDELDLPEAGSVLVVGEDHIAACEAWADRGFAASGVRVPEELETSAVSKTADVVFVPALASQLSAEGRHELLTVVKAHARAWVILHDRMSLPQGLAGFVDAIALKDNPRFGENLHDEMSGHFPELHLVEIDGSTMWYVGRVS